eukprot:g831.t1
MMRSKARGQAEEIPAKRRRRVAGGGGREAAAGAEEPRYFDRLSEDLIGDVVSFLDVRDLEKVCHTCKAVSQVALRFMPLWIGIAASAGKDGAGGDNAARGLPAHVKPSLGEALAAFQRFRVAGMGGRGLEIRLVDNAQHTTGEFFEEAPSEIGCKDCFGLQLDGVDHWRRLRVLTPELDVLYS